MKLYLAGPMTGHPQFNFPRFDAMAEGLRELGYEIQSPAELDDPETRAAALASQDGSPGSGTVNGDTWGDFLARDVKLVADGVDGIAVFHDWWTSRGARLEAYCAHLTGKPVYCAHTLLRHPAEKARLSDEQIEAGSHGRDPLRGDDPTTLSGEVRVTDPETGGQKGRKPERWDLLPYAALDELARVYAFGAEKYEAHNYLRGYAWSLSLGALQRHVSRWAQGVDTDDETGLHHLAHAAWHCLALLMFAHHDLGTDDRWRPGG